MVTLAVHTYMSACKHVCFQYFEFPDFLISNIYGFVEMLKSKKYGKNIYLEIPKTENVYPCQEDMYVCMHVCMRACMYIFSMHVGTYVLADMYVCIYVCSLT